MKNTVLIIRKIEEIRQFPQSQDKKSAEGILNSHAVERDSRVPFNCRNYEENIKVLENF